jgi:hypothetical protein
MWSLTPNSRKMRRPGGLVGGLVLTLALVAAGCGLTTSPGAGGQTAGSATPTTPPNATACSQVYGFANAQPLALPGFNFPPGTVGVQRATAAGDDRLTVVEYAVCVPNGELAFVGDAGGFWPIFAGNWQNATAFPADGRRFTPCAAGGTLPQTAAVPTVVPSGDPSGDPTMVIQPTPPIEQAMCQQLPTMVFAMADQAMVEGQGLTVFRLRNATPPHPCDGTVFGPPAGGSGQGYPQDVAPLMGYDETRVSLPPLSLYGPSQISLQAADGTTNLPYAEVPVCTQGTRDSIVRDLRQGLPGYGWAAENAEGTQWVTTTQGGGKLHARFDGLETPQHWTLILAANLDETPVFPTPVPPGPDATCASVPGLAQAQPLRLPEPGVGFPGDTVAVVAKTSRGSAYTIVDYFACAPHFKLTSNPLWGSGGYPLYAVFDQQVWAYSSTFPFDGVNQQSCDYTPVGNYLTQFCRSRGTTYMEIERVQEPGKGLVAFHLLYATRA